MQMLNTGSIKNEPRHDLGRLYLSVLPVHKRANVFVVLSVRLMNAHSHSHTHTHIHRRTHIHRNSKCI